MFVTAYDSHALEAFESNAVDYIVKPLETERLAKVVAKLKRLTTAGAPQAIDALMTALQSMGVSLPGSPQSAGTATNKKLDWLQVAVGTQIRMVNVQDVCYL